MNIEDMTINELKEKAKRCVEMEARKMSDIVLIRTYSAGVHFGKLDKREGREVTLTNARRVWQWRGARTLSEMALRGVDTKSSRISEAVPSILLLEAIEVIPVTEEAAKNLYAAEWKA